MAGLGSTRPQRPVDDLPFRPSRRRIGCLLQRQQSRQEAGRQYFGRDHGRACLRRIEGAVGTRCQITEPAGLVSVTAEVARQDGRPPGLARHRTRRSRNQIPVPLLASWRLLAEDFEDSQLGGLERRVAGLDGMHESHAGALRVEFNAGEASCLIELHGFGEMLCRLAGVFEDIRPAGIAQGKIRTGAFITRSMKPPSIIEAGRTSGLMAWRLQNFSTAL